MANVKSYAWSSRLAEAVPDGGEAVIDTPGFASPENYQTDEADVVIDARVLTPEEVEVAWESDFAHVHLTNNMGAEWGAGQTLAITVAGKTFDPADVEGDFDALQAQVDNNSAAIADLDVRVAALESAVGEFSGVRLATDTSEVALDKKQDADSAEDAKHEADHEKHHSKRHDEDHSKAK
jgi:hypothetical protein